MILKSVKLKKPTEISVKHGPSLFAAQQLFEPLDENFSNNCSRIIMYANDKRFGE